MTGHTKNDARPVRRPVEVLDPTLHARRRTRRPARRVEQIELKIALPGPIRQEGNLAAIRRILRQPIRGRSECQDPRLPRLQVDLAHPRRSAALERIQDRAREKGVTPVRTHVHFGGIGNLSRPGLPQAPIEPVRLLIRLATAHVSRPHPIIHSVISPGPESLGVSSAASPPILSIH